MKWSTSSLLLIVLVLMGCEKEPIETTTEGALYLNEILDIMEKNSVNRRVINWSEFRKAVREKAPNVKTIAQTEQAIELALKLLNDHHSYYQFGNTLFWDREHCPWFNIPDDIITPQGIGYIRIKGFASTNIKEANEFATALQTTIKSQDNPELKGWLVDLRGNGGGNMWPMIAGVGPILGESIAGYFIYEAEIESYWYKGGTSYLNGRANSTVSEPYTLINPNPKVAVLSDAAGSSGEATVIAFYDPKRSDYNIYSFDTRNDCLCRPN